MEIFEFITELIWFGWGLFSIWTLIRIFRVVWPTLKEDWFWFAWKGWYYAGFGLGIIWFILYSIPTAFLGPTGRLLGILLHVIIIYFVLRRQSPTRLEWAAWLSIPTFIFPFWFAYRQGVRNGEVPTA